MCDSVPSARLISTIKEQCFTSLGGSVHFIKDWEIGVNLTVDIFTESNNGDTFNWSHTPVYLITHGGRDKVGEDSSHVFCI